MEKLSGNEGTTLPPTPLIKLDLLELLMMWVGGGERQISTYICCFTWAAALFRNKRFVLNEMFERNASKFATFYEKKTRHVVLFFLFDLHLIQLDIFTLWMPWNSNFPVST